jgi:hypothetical protein
MTDGLAWRIDIFDAVRFDTLAEARRRPYLHTRQAWPEYEGRELRSRQGLFRLQWVLESYYDDHGYYPDKLHGGEDSRDALIKENYLTGSYPHCGFADRPMELVDFGERSSGDFTYYSADTDGDDQPEVYWLLLHGKIREHYYYTDYDITYVLSSVKGGQNELAEGFAAYILLEEGIILELTGASEPIVPRGALVPTPEQAGLVEQDGAAAEPPVEIGTEPEAVKTLTPVVPGEPIDALEADPAAAHRSWMLQLIPQLQRSMINRAKRLSDMPAVGDAVEDATSGQAASVQPLQPLTVYHFGF